MDEDIIGLRLVTGEYVVAKRGGMDEQGDMGIDLIDPLIFEIVPGQEKGQFGMPVRPLIPLAKPGDGVTLQHRDIMFTIENLAEAIVEQYKDYTTPNDKKIIVPGSSQNIRRVK